MASKKEYYIEIIKKSPYYYQVDERVEDYFPITNNTFTSTSIWEEWMRNLPSYYAKERVFLDMVASHGHCDCGLENVPPTWLWDKKIEYRKMARGAVIVQKRQQPTSSCFVRDTPIWTIDGIKAIQDVRVGDKVITHKGRFSRVAILFKNTCHGRRLYNVYSAYGKVATATEDHPFLVYDELLNHIVWKKVNMLTQHDFLMRSCISECIHLPRPDYSLFREYPQLNEFIHLYPETAGLVVSRVNENHGVLDTKSNEEVNTCLLPRRSDGNLMIYEDFIFLLTDPNIRMRLWKWVLISGQKKFVNGWMSVFHTKTIFYCQEEAELVSMVLNLYQYNMNISPEYSFLCFLSRPRKWKMIETKHHSIKKKDGKLFVKYSHKRLFGPSVVNKHMNVYSMSIYADHSYSANGHVVENCGNDQDEENTSVAVVRVAGHTRILTRQGIVPISSRKDEIVSVWNGEVFVDTMIREMGGVSKSFRIHFSHGLCLVCAPNHLFLLDNGQTVSASKIQSGDTLAPFRLPIMTPSMILPSSVVMTLEWVASRCVYREDWVIVYDNDLESLRDILLDLQYCGLSSWIVHNPHRNEHELRMDKIQWRLLNHHHFNDKTIGMFDISNDDSHVPINIVRVEESGLLPVTFTICGGVLEGVAVVEEIYAYLDLTQFLIPNPMRVHLKNHEIIVFTTANNPFYQLLTLEYNEEDIVMKDVATCEEEWERKRHAHALSNVPAIFLDNNIYVGDFIDFWDNYLCPIIDTERLCASINELLRHEHDGMRIGVYGWERIWVEMRLSSDDPRARNLVLNNILQPLCYFKRIKEDVWDAFRDKLTSDLHVLGISREQMHQLLTQRSIQDVENIPNYLKKIYR